MLWIVLVVVTMTMTVAMMVVVSHSCYLGGYQGTSEAATQLVIFMVVKDNPPPAPPARHEAVLALPLVYFQVCLGRREVARGKPALEGEVQGLNGLLSRQVADPIRKIKTYMNKRYLKKNVLLKFGVPLN